jgi:hypothetical protein
MISRDSWAESGMTQKNPWSEEIPYSDVDFVMIGVDENAIGDDVDVADKES